MESTDSLLAAARAILGQLNTLVEHLSDEEFVRPSASLHAATVGQHLRHSLEFFTSLAEGASLGIVNYDLRKRNPALETQRAVALQTVSTLLAFLQEPPAAVSLILEVSYAEGAEKPARIPTHFHRELVYNIEHAVHHMALIKIGLKEVAPHMAVPQNFGVAVSTLRYKKAQTAVAE